MSPCSWPVRLFLIKEICLYLFFLLVPAHFSDQMRHLIQALLITYAQPALNRTMNDQDDNATFNSRHSDPYWCQHFIHPRFCPS